VTFIQERCNYLTCKQIPSSVDVDKKYKNMNRMINILSMDRISVGESEDELQRQVETVILRKLSIDLRQMI
jgi:hypothetical protein